MSEKVTIAQALRRIKKLKGQIAEHSTRAQQGVSYVSTKVPAFRFADAVEALRAAREEMLDLESRVAVANAKKTLTTQDGRKVSLARAVRELQELKGEIALLRGLNLRSETVRERETEWNDDQLKNITRFTEVTYQSDLTEQSRDSQIKALQDAFEVLNNAVEEANHTVTV